ncbi:MAG: hypothetical protein HUJ31_10070 [Pseudomonadales bacterium]|nr:hypothetical protein [Pseudomonadales bacterium]
MSNWKDPINRDESIDQTTASAVVSKTTGGLYEYVYTIDSSVDNQGTIANFSLDVSCDLDFGDVTLPPEEPHLGNPDASADGKHVPIVTYSAPDVASAIGISTRNKALWVLGVKPGQVVSGFKLVSQAPPGLRTYTMEPDISTWGWRYDLYEPGDPRIKWLQDYRVTGEVIGPACKLDDDPEIAFLGAAEEPFGINRLLAYATPINAAIELTAAESLELIVFYDQGIDAKTFKGRLNGKDISSLFSPEAGPFEKVIVTGPWKKNNNRLHLSALGNVGDKERGNNAFKSIDNDVFEIDIK